MNDNLLIRADASVRTGTGHVMRCLSLAQGWVRAGGHVMFACADILPAVEARLTAEGFALRRHVGAAGTVEDADLTAKAARATGATWVVADGYHFRAAFQREIKNAGLRLLLLDDYGHSEHYFADLVLNQNLAASADPYANREPYTRLLLGSRYVLLREQFRAYRNWQREVPDVARKVLVTLGGTDPDGVTGKVVTALQGLDVESRVVAGAGNSRFEAIAAAVRPPTTVLRDATDMPGLMAWADVAVAAGGTTAWELAYMGLPSLALTLAENQRAVVDALAAAKIALRVDPDDVASQLAALLPDAARRSEMSQEGRRLVDGDGVNRVLRCMAAAALSLRRVRPGDSALIHEWANDPETRQASFSTDAIPFDVHAKWFALRVDSPTCIFLIAEDAHGVPVGQIRFDVSERDAVVSVSVANGFRGHGYGSVLIGRGVERCFLDMSVERICAYVKPGNKASTDAFVGAGFSDAGVTQFRGHAARLFILKRGAAR